MRMIAKLALAAWAAAAAPRPAAADAYGLLYSFTGGQDGQSPSAPLVPGPNGLVYGATAAGGAHGHGTVYRYAFGSAQVTTLYAFPRAAVAGPDALTVGPDGTLYGTLQYDPHDGAVFKLDPSTGAYTTLYTFKASRIGKTGFYPGAIAVDRNGTVYGQTLLGGPGQSGTVFQLRKNGKLRVLLAFNNSGSSVPGPISLIHNALYGVICEGSNNTGSVYTIPTATGVPQTLYQFSGAGDGGCPAGAVTRAGNDVIDGFTTTGGTEGSGVIYQLNTSTGAQTVLFDFPGGFRPALAAILPSQGHVIYGVRNDPGTVFAVDTSKHTIKQLGGTQGEQGLENALPLPGLVLEGDQILGVTAKGGSANVGTLFTVAR